MNDKVTLCFVIVSYNSEVHVEKCIDSIHASNIPYSYDIVVVDNASSDSTLSILSKYEKLDRVKVLRNNDNLGFGAANNLGVEMVSSEYYFLLNVDAYFEDDFQFFRTLEVFETNPDLAILGPRLCYPDGSPQTTSFSKTSPLKWGVQVFPFYESIKRNFSRSSFLASLLSGISPIFSSYFSNQILHSPDYTFESVDWVSGAAMIVSRRYIEEHGLFDDGIFLYGEDEDLCLNAKQLGWAVFVQNTNPIVHVHGWNSTSRFNPVVARLKYRSLLYFIDKWFVGWRRVVMKALLPVYVYGWGGFLRK